MLEHKQKALRESLRHLFERRLRRELTKAEQAGLSSRLDTEGIIPAVAGAAHARDDVAVVQHFAVIFAGVGTAAVGVVQ